MLRSDYGLMLDLHFGDFEDHIEESAYQLELKLNPNMELRTELNLLARVLEQRG